MRGGLLAELRKAVVRRRGWNDRGTSRADDRIAPIARNACHAGQPLKGDISQRKDDLWFQAVDGLVQVWGAVEDGPLFVGLAAQFTGIEFWSTANRVGRRK